ncbi:hypothetical protein HDU93_009512, partial [Gonapodya sp. JEL0774]
SPTITTLKLWDMSTALKLTLVLHPTPLSFCRYPPSAPVPKTAMELLADPTKNFLTLSRTPFELSLTIPTESVATLSPPPEKVSDSFLALQIDDTFEFDVIGILAPIAKILADARIAIMAEATYDTDWILIGNQNVDKAVEALRAAGHVVKQ